MSELQETAFRLYTSGESYESVRAKLGIDKKQVIELVKAQGQKLLEMADNEKEPENEAFTATGGETVRKNEPEVIQPQPIAPHRPIPPLPMATPEPSPSSYADQEYDFELVTAVGKQINLSHNELGIFDTARSAGYDGDLSALIRESMHFWFARTNLIRRQN